MDDILLELKTEKDELSGRLEVYQKSNDDSIDCRYEIKLLEANIVGLSLAISRIEDVELELGSAWL